MEERAVLANIASIITKDLLIDQPPVDINSGNYPLLSFAEDDDEAEIFALMQRKRALSASRKRRMLQEPEDRKQDLKLPKLEWHHAELNLLHRYTNAQFESYLHMRKLTFLKIQQVLEETLGGIALPGYPTPPAQTMLSLAMWRLSTDEHFEEIARKFRLPWALCQQVVRGFWHCISDNYESFIKWPNSLAAQRSTLQGYQKLEQLRCFRELFGIITLRRLDVFLESEHAEVPVVLQLICNAERKIIDCYVELAMEYSFEDSPIGQTLALNPRTMPAGTYLIGNEVFPLKSYLMRPIEAECFRKDAVFNELLRPAFQLAEQVLDTLARRFNTLYALEARDLNEVRLIVESICAMHNLCEEFQDDGLEETGQSSFSWGRLADGIRGSEKDSKGLQRRVELLDELVAIETGE
ncbi:LOW QUALITY PROTEIN: uncharacterized protein LOC128257172 [Drosophila gunungcola]|uniref:LOW QUALITY PROTEIN: uncharacterized protein LOC128257172 n=1 Tax=Drosophila gunungcola TaxID=103775 RepID=UPI0022E34DBB|nr:LOW QUALITY PROTEIN: uncharacterized protein LOC128257172 [Drosophila gunungcola]